MDVDNSEPLKQPREGSDLERRSWDELHARFIARGASEAELAELEGRMRSIHAYTDPRGNEQEDEEAGTHGFSNQLQATGTTREDQLKLAYDAANRWRQELNGSTDSTWQEEQEAEFDAFKAKWTVKAAQRAETENRAHRKRWMIAYGSALLLALAIAFIGPVIW